MKMVESIYKRGRLIQLGTHVVLCAVRFARRVASKHFQVFRLALSIYAFGFRYGLDARMQAAANRAPNIAASQAAIQLRSCCLWVAGLVLVGHALGATICANAETPSRLAERFFAEDAGIGWKGHFLTKQDDV